MDGWKITFLLGWPIFRGELLDFELLGFGSVDDDHLGSFSAACRAGAHLRLHF